MQGKPSARIFSNPEFRKKVATSYNENPDGSITATETTTTIKKTTKIDYDAIDKTEAIVVQTEVGDMRYINALRKKDEVVVFMDSKGHYPVETIQLESFERILKLLGKELKDGFDLVVYCIYSMEEIWEFKQSVRKYRTGKCGSSGKVVDYKKEYMVNIETTRKMERIWMCFDNLGIIEEEVERVKEVKRLKEENEKRRIEEEKRKMEEEEKLRKIKEEEERLRREKEEEERIRREEEERERLRREEEERKKKEEERLRQLEEEKQKKLEEEKERLRQLEEEERIKQEREMKERLRKEEEERQRKLEEEKIRKIKEEEERLRKLEEERFKQEEEEKEKERQRKLEEERERERLRKEEEERLRKIEEEKERLRKEEEEREKQRKEEEERQKKIEEEKERLRQIEEEERLKKEEEERIKREIQERLKKEMEARLRQAEEARLRKEEEDKLKQENEEQLRKQQEEDERKQKEQELQRQKQLELEQAYQLQASQLPKQNNKTQPLKFSEIPSKPSQPSSKNVPRSSSLPAKKPLKTKKRLPNCKNKSPNGEEEEIIDEDEFMLKKRIKPKEKFANSVEKQKPQLQPSNNQNKHLKPLTKSKPKLPNKTIKLKTYNDNETSFDYVPKTSQTSLKKKISSGRANSMENIKPSNKDIYIKKVPFKKNKYIPPSSLKQFITGPTYSGHSFTQYTGKKPIKTITTTPIKSTLNGNTNNTNHNDSNLNNQYRDNPSCFICKGLPIKPHECSNCYRQYCSLCTYELKNPNRCDGCGGKLNYIAKPSATPSIQAYEANISKYQNKTDVSNNVGRKIRTSSADPSTHSKYLNISAKDFFENNRDRFLNDSWKQTLAMNSNKDIKPNESTPSLRRLDYLNKSQQLPEERSYCSINTQPKKAPIQLLNERTKQKARNTFKTIRSRSIGSLGTFSPYLNKYTKGTFIHKTFIIDQNDPIWSICYIPKYTNGEDAIITGHLSGIIYIWDINVNMKIKMFCEHTSKIYDIKLLPSESSPKIHFLSISEDRSIKLWDTSSQRSLLTIIQLFPIYCIDTIYNQVLISGDKNKNIYIHHIHLNGYNTMKTYTYRKYIESHDGFIWRILLLQKLKHNTRNINSNTNYTSNNNSNCYYLVTASDKCLMLFQMIGNDNKKIEYVLTYRNAHNGLIHDLIELTNKRFASCGADGVIKIWDVFKETCLRNIIGLFDVGVFSMIYLNDIDIRCYERGEDVFMCGSYNTVKVFGVDEVAVNTKENIYRIIDKKEGVYRMKVLTHNNMYRFVSINYGGSGCVYLWGFVDAQ